MNSRTVSVGRCRSLALVLTMVVSVGCSGTGAAVDDDPPLQGRAAEAPERCQPEATSGPIRALSFRSLEWMGEPVLACGPLAEDEAYRFIFQSPVRTVSPVSVRLSRSEGQAMLIARTYAWSSEPGAPQPLSVVSSKIRSVSEDEWRALVSATKAAGFWDMAVEAEAPATPLAATWDLEGRLGRGYHHVARVAPDPGPFRDLAIHVLQLAGYGDPLASPPAGR